MEIIVLCIRISVLPDDELLPLVHQIWQPLKLLFESNNIFVVDRAFSLLNTLALSAKDFIRRRSEQDVFPHILKYLSHLKSLMLNSSKEGSSSL
ncbi:TELO2interacting protein 1 -like protein [Caligus rogercresseyi]|uniref:TELO2interacting protein 1 -like protein n=1 Tax=Caligus rogercresseyi TaxID=217165 RepID=A0A7T8KJS5_CALRO|nr:TELO2interacting protein 1 -like protein [Caligus rogercresseyi]